MSKKDTILLTILVVLVINITFVVWWIFILKNSYIWTGQNFNIDDIQKITNKKVVEQKLIENRNISDLENNITKVVETVSSSVVNIVVSKELKRYLEDPYDFFGGYIEETKEKVWWWSGILLTSDGYIVTNKHVIEDMDSDYSIVTKNGDSFDVERIRLDPIIDIAILKILDAKWSSVSKLIPAKIISINSTIKIWQFVIAIWNALAELENTVTFGIISGKNRKLDELKYSTNNIYAWLYQTDATINHGNSWWPLLDINGNVIWINTAISSEWQWIWFSIPINNEFIQTTMDIIKNNWKIIRPYLWIDYLQLNKSIAKNMDLPKFEGLYINSVSQDSPFEWKIKKGDIITSMNWKNIRNETPFMYTLFTFEPWETVNFVVYSDKKYNKLKIKLWEVTE